MRKLAHIEKIEWISPIPNADNIELVGVLGWQCIAKKGEFQLGDKCIYIEIDSIVDKNNSAFAFLEPRGFKIKTMKMRGVLSQGIVFPLSILPDGDKYAIGDDVTDVLNITKIEDDVPSTLPAPTKFESRHRYFSKTKIYKYLLRFDWFKNIINRNSQSLALPSWIKKTDETRVQDIPWIIERAKGIPLIVTEKLDGTSATFGLRKLKRNKYEFVVCSRNQIQSDLEKDKNFYYQIAEKYNIRAALEDIIKDMQPGTTAVLQGEIIGSGIQKNKYHINDKDFYAFNLLINGHKVCSLTGEIIVERYNMKWVPILETEFQILPTVAEMLAYADWQSVIGNTLREGLVIRSLDNSISFKCVSNKFLLKNKL